jgi:small subunit ribosomal protein S21
MAREKDKHRSAIRVNYTTGVRKTTKHFPLTGRGSVRYNGACLRDAPGGAHRRKETHLTQVQVKPGESIDSALKRFKKALEQTGVLKEAREHERYEKPSDKRRKAENARRRKIAKLHTRLKID